MSFFGRCKRTSIWQKCPSHWHSFFGTRVVRNESETEMPPREKHFPLFLRGMRTKRMHNYGQQCLELHCQILIHNQVKIIDDEFQVEFHSMNTSTRNTALIWIACGRPVLLSTCQLSQLHSRTFDSADPPCQNTSRVDKSYKYEYQQTTLSLTYNNSSNNLTSCAHPMTSWGSFLSHCWSLRHP